MVSKKSIILEKLTDHYALLFVKIDAIMPTPFMHLDYAERMLAHPDLDGHVRETLTENLPLFYLGSVVVDINNISDVKRSTTHFHTLPLTKEQFPVGFERMMQNYPQLDAAHKLETFASVYVAGYAVHLLMDLVWLRRIIVKFFVYNEAWADVERMKRFLGSTLLLAYLTDESVDVLPQNVGDVLDSAEPPSPLSSIPWLPLDAVLDWQKLVSSQIRPGGQIQTDEIYGERMGVTPQQFRAYLEDDEWLQKELFDRVSLEGVKTVLEAGIDDCVTFLNEFFKLPR